jgi:hypothetical protein
MANLQTSGLGAIARSSVGVSRTMIKRAMYGPIDTEAYN